MAWKVLFNGGLRDCRAFEWRIGYRGTVQGGGGKALRVERKSLTLGRIVFNDRIVTFHACKFVRCF